MSDRSTTPVPAGSELPLRGSLLTVAIRRDVTDLNRLFLHCALQPDLGSDPWFHLPERSVGRLAQAAPGALDRLAQSPFTLFELSLPAAGDRHDWRPAAVADEQGLDAASRLHLDARRSFGLIALGVARRQAEGAPLAPRITFRVGAELESRLSRLSPSESFGIASWSGLVRPRWPRHERFWCMLAAAACSEDEQMLRWAFATGMCLPPHGDRAIPCAEAQSARRKLRAAPVRS